jgi:Icc-related predicted phosphoesterase
MKIIAFGDIHMATAETGRIPGIREADLIILNGDLTNYGGTAEVRSVLDDIMKINPNVLAQFGNLDGGDVNDYLEELGINLHGQARLVQGEVCLIGVGGSNFTPFNTPSEFPEKEISNLANKAFQQGLDYIALAQPLHNRKIPQILVSHVPPFNTQVDKLHNGKHVGSKAIRTVIEKYQPDLCITGHIHEAKGKDKILKTPIYNHGMLRQGGWISIDIQQSQLQITLQ